MVQGATQTISVNDALQAVKTLSEIVRNLRGDVFQEGVDFGVIPGTGDKPTLLLPGMEKLMRALRLRPEYHAVSVTEDFINGLFAYRYECRLIEVDTGLCVSTAIGSCNSKESKYRWRDQKRTCPKCGKETINRSKFPPKNDKTAEPGWYCYAKVGGCGAEFAANDGQITVQAIGRIENPDIYDQVNTIDKIAQKRALGSAIKGAANVSEFFTVDLEDLRNFEDVVEGQFTVVAPPKLDAPANVDPEAGEITDTPENELDKYFPWSAKEQTEFWTHWTKKTITQSDIFAALGISKGLSEWTKSRSEADAAVKAYIAEKTAEIAKG